jgi:endonuclease/exonuclease/phosphatase family metal-dependent hydrolase
MSYNIKGLPWPVASGRPEQLARIGRRLAELRGEGLQPHIVLLQEAFTDEAKAIGQAAGYRYAAWGPGPESLRSSPQSALGPSFAAQASALKGEGLGKVLDSGLAIFSDYPILASSGQAFPPDACAGFDCLAAKGVLLAQVRIPGQAEPLTVINTHLNSDVSSSGVGEERTDAAFAWQFAAIRDFAASRIPANMPAIVGGDLNIGPSEHRWAQAQRIGLPLAGAREAVGEALQRGPVLQRARPATQGIYDKRIDRLFYRAGRMTSLSIKQFDVPFTTGAPDSLSDHAGFVATYDLRPVSSGKTRKRP